MNETAAVCGLGPAHRLDRSAHSQCVLVERQLPGIEWDSTLEHQPPEVAVGADVVEPVVMHAFMGEMRRHVIACETATQFERFIISGSVELQDGLTVEKTLSPLGPAACGVPTVD